MEISQQLLAVGLVLALLLLAAAAAQRRGWLRMSLHPAGPARQKRELELVERFVLTPQHQLHLMRVEDRTVLIATHPQGVHVVPLTGNSTAAAGGRP